MTAANSAPAAPHAPPAPGESPYLAGLRHWHDRYADQARGKARWQHVAFVLAALLAIETVGLTALATQSRLVPYVVEVDRLGRIGAVAPLEPGFREPERRILVQQLTEFVQNVRAVYSDPIAQDRLSRRALAYAGPEARRFLEAYYGREETNPVVLGSRLTRVIEITSVLRQPDTDTWTVEWAETEIPVGHGSPTVAGWKGSFRVQVRPPRSEELVLANPLGIYVTAIGWSRITEPRALTEVARAAHSPQGGRR